MIDLPVLAVTGLAREARLAAGPGVEAVGVGGNTARLMALLDARVPPACAAVVSFGIAGGLDPALAPGTVVLATGVVAAQECFPTHPALAARLSERLTAAGVRIVAADVAGVDEAVLSVEGKAELRRVTGAAAVDMESHAAAAFAARHSLPFAVLRVVCDPAGRALPAFVTRALTPNGEPDVGAVLAALVRREVGVSALWRLSRDSGAAFGRLSRVRPVLGFGLGLLGGGLVGGLRGADL